MKWLTAIAVIAVIVAPSFVAAGGSEESPTTSEAKVTVRMWDWAAATTSEATKAMVSEFNAKHPAIEVVYDFQGPNGGEMLKKLTVSMAGGAPPEISVLMEAWTTKLIESGLIVPVEDYIKGRNGLSESELSDFIPQFIEPFTFKGKLSFLPLRFEASAIAYNKELLRQAGYQEFPKTWEQFVEMGKKLTKDTDGDGRIDQWATDIASKETWKWAPFLWGAGGDFFDKTQTKAAFDSPEGRTALRFYSDLILTHKIAPLAAVSQGFETGKVASRVMGSWNVVELPKLVNFEIGAAFWPYPSAKGPDSVRALSKIGVFGMFKTGSSAQSGAWTFIKWLTDTPNLARYCSTASWLPVRQSVAKDPTFVQFIEKYPTMKVFIENQERIRLTPIIPAWATIDYDVVRSMIEKVFYQKATVEEALAEGSRLANEALAAN